MPIWVSSGVQLEDRSESPISVGLPTIAIPGEAGREE